MNKRSKSRDYVLDFLILAIFVLSLVILLNSRTVLGNLIPSTETQNLSASQPTNIFPAGTSSQTPVPGEIRTPSKDIGGVPTLAFKNILDTAPDLPINEKANVIVRRANGDYDLYYLRDSVTDLTGIVALGPGDKIISWVNSDAFMRHGIPQMPTPIPPSLTPIVPTTSTFRQEPSH